jgi:hypothetical protein
LSDVVIAESKELIPVQTFLSSNSETTNYTFLNGKPTTLNASLVNYNNCYSFGLGTGMEIYCFVESWTEQSSCMVCLHCDIQYNWDIADYLYSDAQAE